MNAIKITLFSASILGLMSTAHAGSGTYSGGPKGAPALEASSNADSRINSYASIDRTVPSVDFGKIRKGGIGARGF
jgi:hypothetical protein